MHSPGKLMRFKLLGLAVLSAIPVLAGSYDFAVSGVDKTPWTKLLQSVQLTELKVAGDKARVLVLSGESPLPDAGTLAKSIVVIQGMGAAAQRLGFTSKAEPVLVRQIRDTHAPDTPIIWEQSTSLPTVDLPTGFHVFAWEKWKNAPLLAGKRTGQGAILWIATSPGDEGFERFPYLLQALTDLGLECPLQTTNLWAFFDSAYRVRADSDYLARRWRQAGIGVLHVAGWHNMESDPEADRYLQTLIEACHRNSILVYAWLELPHVSEKFWADHPAWREKTAVGQDAQLDWRKLMNLQNPECHSEVLRQITGLLTRFDWDGVNLAELYFESLEGTANPARFTPMNDDVRRDFQRTYSFDPKLLFDPSSSQSAAKNPNLLRQFLDYRSSLAVRMQGDWLNDLETVRRSKPYLDFVLTHIDDRFDPAIKDLLGADVARSLPVLQSHRATLLVEDPATLWSLGPERYAKLSSKYASLIKAQSEVAVDLNVVDRYQDVYPTKKQTGAELFELVHQAASGFGHVAIYFENSLPRQDLSLLPVAGAKASLQVLSPDEVQVDAQECTRVKWQGPVELDDKPWPVQDKYTILVPAGKHRLTPGVQATPVPVLDFNGNVQSAAAMKDRTEIVYNSRSRASIRAQAPISEVKIDGVSFWKPADSTAAEVPPLLLPAGRHSLTLIR